MMIDDFSPSGVRTWRELFEVSAKGRETALEKAREAGERLTVANDTLVHVMSIAARYVAARDAYEEEARRNWGPDKELPRHHPILIEWLEARSDLRRVALAHADHLKEYEK